MKKIATYILSALMLSVLDACTADELRVSDGASGPVTLEIGMMIPEAQSVKTRGLLDEAKDENSETYLEGLIPYLFIFEDTGQPESNYLRTLVHGDLIRPTGHDADTEHGGYLTYFSATVDGTAEHAIVHLVLIQPGEQAAFEEQLSQMTDRSELGMFSGASGLYTSSATYWKRIPLGMSINRDNLTAIKDKLSHIRMLRNFAQVTMDKASNLPDSEFEIEGFAIVNAMDCGYVAAYNESTGSEYDNFVDFEKDGAALSFDALTKEVKYIPSRHPKAYRANRDDALAWVDELTAEDWNPNVPKYMFERPVQDTHRTFVLLKGKYRQGSSTYYKIEIGDYDKSDLPEYEPYGVFEPYNLLRNISYDIKIIGVAAPGHATAASAIAAPPANNISASIETKNILNLTDGLDIIGINIFNLFEDASGQVTSQLNDGTTVVIIADADGKPYPKTANLRWQYFDGETSSYINDQIKYNFPGYDLKVSNPGEGVISSISPWAEAGTNWQGLTLTFNDPGDVPMQETVKFYKPYGLSREVTFILRERWEFVNAPGYPSNVEVYPGLYSYEDNTMPPYETLKEVRDYINNVDGMGAPGKVGSQRGAQFTVMFELPSDIPQSLFPLKFKIGFDRQNAENAYIGNAEVVYGESMFDNVGVPRMQFVKTVTWEYYNGTNDPDDHGHKIVTARFNTTTDVLANNETDNNNGETSTTKVRVTNPYFNLGEDDFERVVKDDDGAIDQNRTTWSWYFGDPGWTNYFADKDHNASTEGYNGLWYNTHNWGTQHGRYMGIPATQSSENNPDFVFYPNAEATAGNYSATLMITGASKLYNNGNTYYRRRSFIDVAIKQTDGTLRHFRVTDNTFFYDRRYGTTGVPLEKSANFVVYAGETIEKVTIWSTNYSNDNNSSSNAETLYYAIQLKLTPQ